MCSLEHQLCAKEDGKHGQLQPGRCGFTAQTGFEQSVLRILSDGKKGIMQKIQTFDLGRLMGGGWTETTLALSYEIHQTFKEEIKKCHIELH